MVLDVRETPGNVKIILSRTHPDFIRALFDLEVPEVAEQIIEIKALAREAGYRTKVAVNSLDSKVDAVGACVGVRGSRIKNIVDELGGEKIDIVRWNDSSKLLIANSLKPAEVAEISTILDQIIAMGMVSVMDVEEVGPDPLVNELKMEPELAQQMVIRCAEQAKVVAQARADAKAEKKQAAADQKKSVGKTMEKTAEEPAAESTKEVAAEPAAEVTGSAEAAVEETAAAEPAAEAAVEETAAAEPAAEPAVEETAAEPAEETAKAEPGADVPAKPEQPE